MHMLPGLGRGALRAGFASGGGNALIRAAVFR